MEAKNRWTTSSNERMKTMSKADKITAAQYKKESASWAKAMREDDRKEKKQEANSLLKEMIVSESKPGAHPELVEVCKALQSMIGATIFDAGFITGEREGGMAFDFNKDGKEMRLVIGYNELGEWVKCLAERK